MDSSLINLLIDHAEKGDLCLRGDFLPEEGIVQEGNRFYLPRLWREETELITAFKTLFEGEPEIKFKNASFENAALLPEQREACRQALASRLSFIVGGPGTGKTFTAGCLVAEALKEKPNLRIALGAPTGKAAAMLKASLERALGKSSIEAETLHRLLLSRTVLPYDLFLVDESSMIDLQLMIRLFNAVKPGARLVMLGDPDQLPPVEAGSCFQDLVEFVSHIRGPGGRLTKCLRAELMEIVEFSQIIKENDPDKALDYLKSPRREKVLWEQRGLVLSSAYKPPILCPLKRGLHGVDMINKRLVKEACLHGETLFPIIITRNDPELELFNGMTGHIQTRETCRDFNPTIGDYATVGSLRFPALLLPAYDLAYALTIHKSQGSEFPEVRLHLPEGSEEFGVNALYTGVTRAKKFVEIFASEDILRLCLSATIRRQSGIIERLKNDHIRTPRTPLQDSLQTE